MKSADPFRGFRIWFYAAAVYNALWGIAVILFPRAFFNLLMPVPLNYPPLFQVLGMMVLIYAPGYYLIAKNPTRYAPFVWIGLLGKMAGCTGFVFYALRGELPWSLGWTILSNDLFWLPAFWSFAMKHARSI